MRAGREFDGAIGNRWWEAKSGEFWNMILNNSVAMERFKSTSGQQLGIAKDHGATFEIISNTPIPPSVKEWLTSKGIKFTEMLD